MTTDAALSSLLREGAEQGVFPGAQACVFLDGEVAYEGCAGEATAKTVYDLASLTKVVCTTAAFIALWEDGKVGPQTPLSRFFPHSPAAAEGASVGDLLYHRSGLPAFAPCFAEPMRSIPELFDPDCPTQVREQARRRVVDATARVGLASERGSSAVYSDMGFILLGEAIALAADAPLDALFESKVARPLGLELAFRRLSRRLPPDPNVAPTGKVRPREPAPGQENLWPRLPPHPSPPGEVDDDNAWAMDGVAGHAGLFGTARQVARFGQAILGDLADAEALAPAALWRKAVSVDASVPGSTRAMGFDTPSRSGSSAGKYIGKPSHGAVGHLGFTGASLWVDLRRKLSVALCTNRTLLGRGEQRIKDFRPQFHDRVVEALGLEGA